MWQDIQPLGHTLHLETSGENPRVFFFPNVKPLIFVQKIIMPKVP